MSSKNTQDDYPSPLLFEAQPTGPDSGAKVVQRFANVAAGYEVVKVWREPLNHMHAHYGDLMLLSLVSQLPSCHLRGAMMVSLTVINK